MNRSSGSNETIQKWMVRGTVLLMMIMFTMPLILVLTGKAYFNEGVSTGESFKHETGQWRVVNDRLNIDKQGACKWSHITVSTDDNNIVKIPRLAYARARALAGAGSWVTRRINMKFYNSEHSTNTITKQNQLCGM
jgi:hypothetical protein